MWLLYLSYYQLIQTGAMINNYRVQTAIDANCLKVLKWLFYWGYDKNLLLLDWHTVNAA